MFQELYLLVGEELHKRANQLVRMYPDLEPVIRRIEEEIESSGD